MDSKVLQRSLAGVVVGIGFALGTGCSHKGNCRHPTFSAQPRL